jgi:hypothetical protein
VTVPTMLAVTSWLLADCSTLTIPTSSRIAVQIDFRIAHPPKTIS